MEITVKIPDELAAEARARGVSVEVYVQEILAREMSDATNERHLESIRAAIDGILELREGNQLAGLRIKDLIHEGHKY
jgi:post-segregation antitoxin (ccd killing protein)